MTATTLLAGAAGLCAAAALAQLRPSRGGGRTPRPERAGAHGSRRERDLPAVRRRCAAVGAAMAATLVCAAPGRPAALLLICAPAAGFLAPDVLSARRARRRRARMTAELADVLDLLRVAVQAGLPTGRALAEVGRHGAGPLAAELRKAATALTLGVPSSEALERFVQRCPIDAAPPLAAAIARAERHGAPLAPTLVALAAAARAEHVRSIREAGARAAPAIQLVVAFLLVPAVMLLVAAALLQTITL